MQTQKWVNLGLLLGGGAVFFFVWRLFEFLWEAVGLRRVEGWLVAPEVVAAIGVVGVAGLWVRRTDRANRFLNEVVVELGKVSWPLRKETVNSSGVVIVLVGMATLLLGVIDRLWSGLTGRVIGALF